MGKSNSEEERWKRMKATKLTIALFVLVGSCLTGCAHLNKKVRSRIVKLEQSVSKQEAEIKELRKLLTGENALVRIAAQRISITDVKGKERARLATAANGIVQLTFFDKAGRVASGLGVDTQDRSYLELYKGGDLRAKLTVEQGGQPALALLEKEGKVRVLMRLGSRNEPSLNLFDGTGRWRAILGSAQVKTGKPEEIVTRPESSLLLFDKEANTVHQLPARKETADKSRTKK